MKKFLSIIALGICFVMQIYFAQANETVDVKMYDKVVVKEKVGFKTVDGYVTNNEGDYTSVLSGEYIKDSKTEMTYEIKGNYFVANALIEKLGKYDFEFVESEKILKDTAGYYFDINSNEERDEEDLSLNPPSFTIVPQAQLDQKFEFDLENDNYLIVSGEIEGVYGKTISVRIKEGSVIASGRINADGSFAILVNPDLVRYSTEIELVLKLDDETEPVVLKTGLVRAKDLDASINTTSFMEGVINRNVNVLINNISSDYYEDNELNSSYKFKTTIFNQKEEEITSANGQSLLINNGESRKLSFNAFSYRGLRELNKGEYNVEIKLLENIDNQWRTIAKEQTSFEVLEANQNILVEEVFVDRVPGEIKIDLGGLDLTRGEDDVIYYKNGKPIKPINLSNTILGGYVLRYNLPGQTQEEIHNLKTDKSSSSYPDNLPAGVNKGNYLSEENQVLEIPAFQGGNLNYTLEVYEVVDNKFSLLHRETDEFVIKGYNVSVENKLIYANKETNQKITITNTEQSPVNNAIIYIGQDIYDVNSPQLKRNITSGLNEEGVYAGKKGYLFLDPSNTNVLDGEYALNNFKLNDLGYYNIVVYKLEDGQAHKMAVVENAIEVIGETAYTVEVDKKMVRPGSEQTYYLTVRDKDGVQVSPYAIDILEDGLVYRSLNQLEVNALQTPKGIKIVYTAKETLEDKLTFRVRNETSSKTGSVSIDASDVEIIFDSLTPVLTDGFRYPTNFIIRDSNSKELIEEDLSISLINGGSGSEFRIFDSQTKQEYFTTVPYKQEYSLELLAYDLNYEEIASAGVKPKVRIEAGNMTVYEIEVREPRLYVEPEKILPATNEITITYKDASNKGIKDKEIRINNDLIGETDTNGEIESFIPSGVETFNILAETDVNNYYKTIAIKREAQSTQSDVINAPEIVNSPEVDIRIRNDYPMLYIYVNDQRQDYFLPVRTYTAEVDGLTPGWNTIRIDILDFRHIPSSYKVDVFYRESKEPIEITIGEETRYGTPTVSLGHTMVPVRFASELGAKMSWNNESKTVTYSYYKTTIELQSGSSYGYINGVRERLPAVPYMNEQDRLMVPLRMIAEELGYKVEFTDFFSPIVIKNS